MQRPLVGRLLPLLVLVLVMVLVLVLLLVPALVPVPVPVLVLALTSPMFAHGRSSVHPFRYFSLGRKQLGAKRDLTPALNCLVQGRKIRTTCGNGNGNGGWNQGIMNAYAAGQLTRTHGVARHVTLLCGQGADGRGGDCQHAGALSRQDLTRQGLSLPGCVLLL